MRVLIASRKSDLARLQARQVGASLLKKNPGLQIEYHFRESLGDREQTNPLWQMPEKGVFTEDFVNGLETGEFDLVVHSWKDLPTEPRLKTEVVATLPRADARDVLLVRKDVFGRNLKEWRVLSSSPRRTYFLGQAWSKLAPKNSPPLSFHSVRGNIPTRLTKLHQGEGEALLVAKAALDRLLATTEDEFAEARAVLRKVLGDCRFMVIPISIQPPAPAQGALAIEIAKNREDLKKLLQTIHCQDTFEAVQWERSQLQLFGGGCHLKLGAWAARRDSLAIRMVKGLPPDRDPVDQTWIERKKSHGAQHTHAPDFCALRSVDLFDSKELSVKMSGDAFYVAHQKALSFAPPADALIWTAGLKTWENLAARGIWVSGSDDSFGEEIPAVEWLVGGKPNWKKLTHKASPPGLLPAIATYELSAKTSVDSEIASRVQAAKFFFWHSGSLFEQALKLWPEIAGRSHSCGMGQTKKTLESKLGPLGEDRIFLDEAEWRIFYGDSDGLETAL